MEEKRKIRIIVVGDEYVGKTSLISAIISQIPTNVERTMRRVILPPDMCKFSKEIFTQIIDTSSTDTDFQEQFNKSDLILLVYDISSQTSIQRIRGYWLEKIKLLAPNIPVILVGNKRDHIQLAIQQDKSYTKVIDILKSVTYEYRQVQMGLECSAYYDRNVKEVLNCAQRAILYPLNPLYDLKNKSLSPGFKKALTRIFRILDKDFDGKLSDEELGALQERVFKSQLNTEDIRVIKDIIVNEIEGSNEDFITLQGFIALHKKCIQTLKIQISWNILRYFKYNNELNLKISPEKFHIENGESLQLTSSALRFLHQLYSYAVKTSPNSPIELIFSCSPSKPDLFQFTLPLISLDTFLYTWNYLAFIDYQQCYRYLYYVGYEADISSTFKKNSGKYNYSNLLKLKQRKILSVLLIDSEDTVNYLNDLFLNCPSENGIQRKYKVINLQGQSKILLLFKISLQSVNQFYGNQLLKKYISDQLRIDLVIHFKDLMKEKLVDLSSSLRQNVENESLLIRQVNVCQDDDNEIQKTFKLKIVGMKYLNLQSIPIQYKTQSYDQLFSIIGQCFSKIDLCLTEQCIIMLKSREKKNIFFSILGGTAVFTGFILYYFFKRKNND